MKRGLRWAVVAAVALNALIGSAALLFGDLDPDEPTTAARVLLTSLSVTLACFVATPSALTLEAKRNRVLGAAGLFSCLVALSMLLVAVWAHPDTEGFPRATATAVTLALAGSLAALLQTEGFSWRRSSVRRAWLVWLALATPLVLLTVWLDEADTGARLTATVLLLAPVATFAGQLWNQRYRPGRSLVKTAWLLWLVTSMVLLLAWVWLADGDYGWHAVATVLLTAVALGHYSIVMLGRLPGRYLAVKAFALAGNAAVTAILLVAIWTESLDPTVARVTGALIVLAAAATILVPVFQRQADAAAGRPDRISFCPHCGGFVNLMPGDAVCPRCSSRFRVDFKRPRAQDETVDAAPALEPLEDRP